MKRIWIAPLCALAFSLAGCGAATMEPPPQALPSPTTPSSPSRVSGGADGRGTSGVELTSDTTHDRRFGEFVREKAGGMIKAVSVSLERKNVLRIEMSEATAPE